MTHDVAGSRLLTLLWIAAAGAVALHNVEEWLLDMTGWIAGKGWHPGHTLHGDQGRFAVALAIVTVAVLALSLVATITKPTWSAATLVYVAYALVINGVSHLVLSVLAGEVMPGVITGVAVLIPLGGFIVHTLPSASATRTNESVARTLTRPGDRLDDHSA